MKEQNKEKLQNPPKKGTGKRVPTKVKNPMGTSFDGLKTENAPENSVRKTAKSSKKQAVGMDMSDKKPLKPRGKRTKNTQAYKPCG